VILISIDTLRPDFLGCYDPELDTSPNIDRLAAESVVFTDVLSHAPSTTISHKSILYSLYPAVHKTRRDRAPEERLPSPIEALREAGFTTGAIVGGGGLAPEIGFPKGFDSYEVLPRLSTGEQLETLRTEARRWLRQHHKDDFFLFLHTYQPHCPYSPPERYASRYAGWYRGDVDPTGKCGSYYNSREMSADDYRYVRDLVKGEVAYVDGFIGDLLAELKRLGIDDDTMVILTSDHGDSLGERGYVGHNLLFNVQLRVPLIVRLPGLRPGRYDAPLELVDVMPTIFRALGQPPPYEFQGYDLLGLVEGRVEPTRDRLRVANQGDRTSLHRGSWHLIFAESGDDIALYDITLDPEEYDDLASRHPEVVAALLRDYHGLMRESGDLSAHFVLPGSDGLRLKQETITRLKALGYIR
jgi:arylsulfatase A-like enzyme